MYFFFFSSRRRHTRWTGDWSSDVCSSDLAMLSAVHACHLMATRVLFAMSRDGLFSKRAATVNEGGTPTVALALSAMVAALFKIGRASCRERVEISVVAGALKDKNRKTTEM